MNKILDYIKKNPKQVACVVTGLLLLKQVGIVGLIIAVVIFAAFRQEIMGVANNLLNSFSM